MTREEILQIAKPILFNTDMVGAILDDRKTATRRKVEFLKGKNPNWTGYVKDELMLYNGTNEPCIKPTRYKVEDYLYVREAWQAVYETEMVEDWESEINIREIISNFDVIPKICAGLSTEYSSPLMAPRNKYFVYRASDIAFCDSGDGLRWRPSIHMPKEAARIFLRVTDVRVERLQDITIDDVLREGVSCVEPPPICIKGAREPEGFRSWSKDRQDGWIKSAATATYIGWCDYADKLFHKMESTWNSTIKAEDLSNYGWNASPWVWVIEFERVEVQ